MAIIAPVARKIADDERLDTAALAAAMEAQGQSAYAPADLDGVLAEITQQARRGDTVVLMSNGTFGGLYDRVIASLTPLSPVDANA